MSSAVRYRCQTAAGIFRQQAVAVIKRAESGHAAEHLCAMVDHSFGLRNGLRADRLPCLLGDDLCGKRPGSGAVQIVFVQDAGGKRDALPLQTAVDRDAAAAAADDKHTGRAGNSRKLNAAVVLVKAARSHAVQAFQIPAGEDLLRRAAAVDRMGTDAHDAVGDFLCQIDLVQRKDE